MFRSQFNPKPAKGSNARLAAALSGVALILAALPSHAATTYSGRGTALQAAGMKVGDTDPLASTGGEQVAPNTSLTLPSTALLKMSLQALSALTKGANNAANSSAQVSGLDIQVLQTPVLPPILNLKATVIEAKTSAQCDAAGKAKATGASVITGLVINGKAVTATASPNQHIALTIGEVILNEQTGSGSKKAVNAIHVNVPNVANVIVSAAESGITCEPPPAAKPEGTNAHGDVYLSKPTEMPARTRSPQQQAPAQQSVDSEAPPTFKPMPTDQNK